MKPFAGENFCELVENKIFVEEGSVADCSLVTPKDDMPTNFIEKTFANSHKTSKFVKVSNFPAIRYPFSSSDTAHQ